MPISRSPGQSGMLTLWRGSGELGRGCGSRCSRRHPEPMPAARSV